LCQYETTNTNTNTNTRINAYNNRMILYLLRISQRVDNILTLELLVNQNTSTIDSDDRDYFVYVLGILAMLLGKIDKTMIAP
jgi:hypothetical protein